MLYSIAFYSFEWFRYNTLFISFSMFSWLFMGYTKLNYMYNIWHMVIKPTIWLNLPYDKSWLNLPYDTSWLNLPYDTSWLNSLRISSILQVELFPPHIPHRSIFTFEPNLLSQPAFCNTHTKKQHWNYNWYIYLYFYISCKKRLYILHILQLNFYWNICTEIILKHLLIGCLGTF